MKVFYSSLMGLLVCMFWMVLCLLNGWNEAAFMMVFVVMLWTFNTAYAWHLRYD